MADVSSNVAGASEDLLSFRADFEQLTQEIEAVPEEKEKLSTINVPIHAATQTVLGAIPEIMALRPRFVKELPAFPIERLDKLQAYARASYHANSLYLIASTPPEAVPALVEECSSMAAMFRADAEALIRRGLLDGNSLRNLRSTPAYRDVALDLYNLVQVLRASWSKVEGKTAIQLSELTNAESLANRLTLALGAREQAPALVGPVALTRHRAYTLFIGAYSEVRRAIAYLEPNKVDEIAPSIYVPRGPSKKKAEEEAPPQPALPQDGQSPATVAPTANEPAEDSPFVA